MQALEERRPSLNFDPTRGVIQTVLVEGWEWRVLGNDGVHWQAQSAKYLFLSPGDHFRVIGRENITLIIDRL